MPQRFRYEIDLTEPASVESVEAVEARNVTSNDIEGLARLMLDAYRGTIDYEDEDLNDALDEVRSYFKGEPILDQSYLIEADGGVVSAILLAVVGDAPFISYVMTRPEHKQRGCARLLTSTAMHSLAEAGHERVALYITDGNLPSEALFRSVGAVRVDSDE